MRARTLALGIALAGAGAAGLRRARRKNAGPVSSTSIAARNAQLAAIGARSGAAYAMHRTRLAAAAPERREELEADRAYVDEVLADGAARARREARETLDAARKACGLA